MHGSVGFGRPNQTVNPVAAGVVGRCEGRIAAQRGHSAHAVLGCQPATRGKSMLELSERARVAIETAPPDLQRRLRKIVVDLDSQSRPLQHDKQVSGREKTWVSRVTDAVRLVYVLEPDRIMVEDVLDYRRYQ